MQTIAATKWAWVHILCINCLLSYLELATYTDVLNRSMGLHPRHTCAILDDETSKCWGSVNPADAAWHRVRVNDTWWPEKVYIDWPSVASSLEWCILLLISFLIIFIANLHEFTIFHFFWHVIVHLFRSLQHLRGIRSKGLDAPKILDAQQRPKRWSSWLVGWLILIMASALSL